MPEEHLVITIYINLQKINDKIIILTLKEFVITI